MELFYEHLKPERNNEETLTIQADMKFNLNKIQNCIKKYNADNV